MKCTINNSTQGLLALLFVCAVSAPACALELSKQVPACVMPRTSVLPANYHQYAWAKKARATDPVVSGKADVRIDGSSLFEWQHAAKVDLNLDGLCDWIVTSNIPLSSGGDTDSINTVYLGQRAGWTRFGATGIRANQADGLGRGQSDAQQSQFAWFDEGPYLLRDATAQKLYVIGNFSSRNSFGREFPGYRIFTWDPVAKKLAELDKWHAGGEGGEVYAYFVAHGGFAPDRTTDKDDRSGDFDPAIERRELSLRCSEEAQKAASPLLATRCMVKR
ncbi:MAG: hypothetical protein H7315_19030 [Herminiimonas sp.]|nr:hypothetical protein [Herminiimonas sp.]